MKYEITTIAEENNRYVCDSYLIDGYFVSFLCLIRHVHCYLPIMRITAIRELKH